MEKERVIFIGSMLLVVVVWHRTVRGEQLHNYEPGWEERLTMKLLENPHLKVRPRGCPAYNCHKAVDINITYNVIQILAFSQSEEILKIAGWFTIVWRDFRLTWNASQYGNISQVFLPPHRLWLPDLGVINGRLSSDFDFSSTVQSRINVDNSGYITWLYGAILDVTCPLDVSYFPFDTQICYMILTPWQSNVHHMVMQPRQMGAAVENGFLPNSNVSEWEIKDVRFHWKTYVSQRNISYQYISISITLTRQPLYFVVMVLVPFSMLSGLACLIFTLDNIGDRLSVALSLILSMTMYVVIVSSSAPRSMRNIPVLGIYLLNQLGLLSIATILAVVNQIISQRRPALLSSLVNGIADSPLFTRKKARSESPRSEYISIDAGKHDLPHLRASALRTHLPSRLFLFRRIGVVLDRLEFGLYLALSAVNGIVCLFVMPAFDDTSELRRQRYENRLETM